MRRELREAGPIGMLYVAEAFRRGMELDEIHRLSQIDPWFLDQVQELVEVEQVHF
jgi:carbamoyl-phosphate synthase large subunit